MKQFLSFLLSLCFFSSYATTYYFSSTSGDDSRKEKEAENSGTPWKTLNKFNSFYSRLKEGDVVLFKRGDVFYGSVIMEERDNRKPKNITIGAYGTGAKPVITGLQTISAWRNVGGGVYEKQDISFPENVNLVLLNGNLQPMGRWPKANAINNGYLTINTHKGSSSITSSEIASAKSFVGGEVVIRKEHWILDRAKVASQTSNAVSYIPFTSSNHTNFTYEARDGYGFFFQNHVNTLTTLGDWCYEASTKKLKMFFGNSNPNDYEVRVAKEGSLLTMVNLDNIIVDNVSFSGANENNIDITYSTNIQIKNSDISFSGINGINVFNGYYDFHKSNDNVPKGKGAERNFAPNGLSNNFKIIGNTISNTNNNAIHAGNSNSWTIQNNSFNNTGMIRGMGLSGDGQYNAIQYINSNSVVENNKITNTGYLGIHFLGDNTVIKNNYVDNFCMIKSDGGGIYTFGRSGAGRKVIGNITSNGIGDLCGTTANQNNPYAGEVHGIYMDAEADNVTIENNTSFANSCSGLFVGSVANVNISNNVLYNNKVVQLKAIDNVSPLVDVNIRNNALVARDSAQLVASYVLTSYYSQGSYEIGTVDHNFYCRPLYEPQQVETQGYPNGNSFYNYPGGAIVQGYTTLFYSLDKWKALRGWDVNTKKSPVNINNLDKLRFEVNTTNSAKPVMLDGNYVDVKGQFYSNSISIAPYSSIVLIKTDAAAPTTYAATNSPIEIHNNVAGPSVSAFPNPFKSSTTVQVTPGETGVASVEVFDQQGRPVIRLFSGNLEAGVPRRFVLNSAKLSAGEYLIRFASKSKVLTKKVVVVK